MRIFRPSGEARTPSWLPAVAFACTLVSSAAAAPLQSTPDPGANFALASALPDSPGALYFNTSPQSKQNGGLPPCPASGANTPSASQSVATHSSAVPAALPCANEDPYSSVVDSDHRTRLTSAQKGYLAIRDVIDPFSLLVLTAQAGIGVAANPQSPYGPGLKGWGRLTGYSLLGDATSSFFGTYAIPSLVHEDPRYRRMEHGRIPHRILHAVAHTFIAESDDGHRMPNYATLGTYPITAELANLYVPGVQCNGPDTARRIGLGLATDPVGNLVAEFLPDVARHIHLRSVFFQQIVNEVALNYGVTH